MEKFEEEKNQYEKEISDHQYVIVQLLEHMQQQMVKQLNMPSPSEYGQMEGRLNHDKNQVENAETTYARLKVELE